MDFSKFDNQSAAENPHKITLHDPSQPEGKGEQLFHGKSECRVLCKLPTAPSVQKARRDIAKRRMAQGKKSDFRDMGVINDEMIEDCMTLIVGFENIKNGEGRALTDSDEDKLWFLRLVFPVMGVEKDEDGNVIKEIAYNRDGDPVSTPKTVMKNDPFAFQIQRKTSDLARELGNGKNG